jgi:hypothetical protein
MCSWMSSESNCVFWGDQSTVNITKRSCIVCVYTCTVYPHTIIGAPQMHKGLEE